MRKFEKISLEQFEKDVEKNEQLYNEIKMPARETSNAAGYDFFAIYDDVLMPGEIKKIPTGIKASMENDEVLLLIDRSGMGFKYNVRMCNQVGVIDSDYYNNSGNEGHIWIKLQNEGKEKFEIKKGEGIIQGIFAKYLTTDDETKNFVERKSNY